MGKIERVNGNTLNVLDKLKGIKADLVRGQDNWQDWDLPQLVVALKKWRDINTMDNPPVNYKSEQNKPPPKRSGSRSNLYHAKDGERKKRACVYSDETTHSSKDCTKVATTTERKSTSPTESFVLTAQESNIGQQIAKVTPPAKSVGKSITPQFALNSNITY